jgi:hypothetical protein
MGVITTARIYFVSGRRKKLVNPYETRKVGVLLTTLVLSNI